MRARIFTIYLMNFCILTTLIMATVHAESVKIIHWWDEYFPPKEHKADYWYEGSKSLQYQDVNGDQTYNDALIWYNFSLTNPLNPPSPCVAEAKDYHRYRVDRPGASFFGGMVARFAGVSQHTKTDRKGEQIPIFDHFQQASVQPTEGASWNLYSDKWPYNIARTGKADVPHWADMTVMVVNCCSEGMSKIFQEDADASVNFSAVFLWKKADFVNGGASASTITFDDTSLLSVDATRFRENIAEGRFVVQDGTQLWISEGALIQDEAGEYLRATQGGMEVENYENGLTGQLKPLATRWAMYDPVVDESALTTLVEEVNALQFDPEKFSPEETTSYKDKSGQILSAVNKMEFQREQATFVEHLFTDVQAVGVYFATYQFKHETTQLVFDNFQAYAVTTHPTSGQLSGSTVKGLALNTEGHFIETTATFSRGITLSGGIAVVKPADQLDIRGTITVDSNHVDKTADIIAVVAYTPLASIETLFFMFNNRGNILPWDGNIASLVALESTELTENKESIVLAPKRQVRIFPVNMEAFKQDGTSEENLYLGCEQRPLSYSGRLDAVPPGKLDFYYGYRLKEDNTVVFNSEPISIQVE